METFEELLVRAEQAHGHLCAGQVLGVRMALLALAQLGIDDPRGADRKRLAVFVEIDRCATDAIGMVTGCRLGKRTLKFRDWGKMAATFVDLASAPPAEPRRALRVVAREDSRQRAAELFPDVAPATRQQMLAYRDLPEQDLFTLHPVRVLLPDAELPGQRQPRVTCSLCTEGVNFGRYVQRNGQTLCLSCADPALRYWLEDEN